MRYFTILAADDAQRTLLEIDIPASELRSLFENIEDQLKDRGFFSPDDTLLKRLVPDYESDLEAVSVQLLNEIPDDLGELPYDIYSPLQDAGVDFPALHAALLWFCSQSEQKIVVVQFPAEILFQAAQEYLMQKIIDQKLGNGRAPFSVSIFLRGQGPLFAQRAFKPRGTWLVVNLKPEDWEEETWQPVELTVTERKSLIVPEKRSWRLQESKLVGVRQRGDLRILMQRKVYDQLWEHVRSSVNISHEVGGFLLGELYKDENDQPFIEISKVMSIDQTQRDYFTSDLRMTPRVSQEAFEEMKEQHPELKRIGWYHAHLYQTFSGSDLKVKYDVRRAAISFSDLDKEIHRNLFPESWQVALVVVADGEESHLAFFQLKKGRIEPCHGFYVYD